MKKVLERKSRETTKGEQNTERQTKTSSNGVKDIALRNTDRAKRTAN
jgi:hypothetical protein